MKEKRNNIMEQKIKNFDRSIEQMMNEHQVTPPFGMWNRISSELETMPEAVAAAAPVVSASLIPKRALAGIIAVALVVGSAAITGYLVYSPLNNNNTTKSSGLNAQITATTKTVSSANTTEQTVSVKNAANPSNISMAKVKVKHLVASNPVQSTIQAAQQVKPAVYQNENAGINNAALENANTDVPTPIESNVQNITEETQTYFFPPIDVNTPEKNKPSTESPISIKNHNKVVTVSADNETIGERKTKFRPHKRRKFTYGNIIR